jgi:hypothetical protein
MAASSGFMIAEAERRFPYAFGLEFLQTGSLLGSTGSKHGSTKMPVPTAGR